MDNWKFGNVNFCSKLMKNRYKKKQIETKKRISEKIFWIHIILLMSLAMLMPISNASTISKNSNTNTDENGKEIIQEQKKEFGIGKFIEGTKEYTGDLFSKEDLDNFLNNAIKGEVDNKSLLDKVLNLFGKEFLTSIKSIGTILVIIIIHSILKSISESLENDGISKMIYYVEYILIVTIIMSNFSSIVKVVQDTSNNLVGFMNLLVPLLISLMLYTGNITTSGILEPIILFMINFIGNLIQTIIIPGVLIFAALVVISKISDNFQISKISKFLQSSIIWFLGIVLTVFVGVVSLEGTLSSSVDGITAKTTKAVVSSAIPVVGKILGDAVDSVLGCGIILKNAVGLIGIIVIVGICISPILKLGLLTITYKLLAGICEPIADKNIVGLIEQVGDIFKIFLAILTTISVLLIVGTALVVKISNTGMMYR